MADIISRSFKSGAFFHAGKHLTTYFNTHFPLSQKQSWQELLLPKKVISLVICSLRGELVQLESLLRLPTPAKNTGLTGHPMQKSVESTHSSPTHLPSNETSSCQPLLHRSGQVFSAKEIKSWFQGSRMRSRPSARPSCWLDNPLPSTERTKNTTSS